MTMKTMMMKANQVITANHVNKQHAEKHTLYHLLKNYVHTVVIPTTRLDRYRWSVGMASRLIHFHTLGLHR